MEMGGRGVQIFISCSDTAKIMHYFHSNKSCQSEQSSNRIEDYEVLHPAILLMAFQITQCPPKRLSAAAQTMESDIYQLHWISE